ncbi:MAG: hypothetical protein ABJN24_00085 [Hyphomicrobiales bacterium]
MMRNAPLNNLSSNYPASFCGAAMDRDDTTGLAVAIEPVRIGPRLSEHLPSFW